jgi:hypothetical protein
LDAVTWNPKFCVPIIVKLLFSFTCFSLHHCTWMSYRHKIWKFVCGLWYIMLAFVFLAFSVYRLHSILDFFFGIALEYIFSFFCFFSLVRDCVWFIMSCKIVSCIIFTNQITLVARFIWVVYHMCAGSYVTMNLPSPLKNCHVNFMCVCVYICMYFIGLGQCQIG